MTRALRSNWLDLALSLLVAIAETAMVAPWLALLAGIGGHPGAHLPAPFGLFFVGFVSYWAARYFLTSGWDLSAARLMSLGTWLVLVIVWFAFSSGTYLHRALALSRSSGASRWDAADHDGCRWRGLVARDLDRLGSQAVQSRVRATPHLARRDRRRDRPGPLMDHRRRNVEPRVRLGRVRLPAVDRGQPARGRRGAGQNGTGRDQVGR